MRAIAVTFVVGLASLIGADIARACTLHEVASASRADLRVYFTRFVGEDETQGEYRDCEIVDAPEDDSITFWVTQFRQDASIVVHPSRWPDP